jgi:hypothetical protein
MKISLKTEGGIAHFPGLSQPLTIDEAHLDPAGASELRRAVDAVRFFDLPSSLGRAAPGAADYRTHTITVEDGDRKHSVRVIEPIAEPALRELVELVRTRARAALRAGRP